MSNITRVCKRCNELFDVLHGNEEYHRDCATLMQKGRSKSQSMAKRFRTDRYWENELIIKRLFEKHGRQIVCHPTALKLLGFDFNHFRGIQSRVDAKIFILTKHGFSFLPNGNIRLWRL